jgi:hypothetical protein
VSLIRATTVSFAIGIVMSIAVGSFAHDVAQYPGAFGWKYTITSRVFYHSPNEPTNWPNGWTARTNDAMDRWNAIPGMSLTRSLGGAAGQNTWSCGESFDFIAKGPTTPGTVAETTTCSSTNSTVRRDRYQGWSAGALGHG